MQVSSAKLCWHRWELSASFPQKLLQVGQFGSPAISSNASLHGQAQQCNTEGFQLKAGCQTAECSGGAETQPCSQRCCQGGNFPLRVGCIPVGRNLLCFLALSCQICLQIAVPSQLPRCWLLSLLAGIARTTRCFGSSSRGKGCCKHCGMACTYMLTLTKDPLGGKSEIWVF